MIRTGMLVGVLAVCLSGPASAQALNIEISFQEKQTKVDGGRRKAGKCTSKIALKTFGPNLFMENAGSNCKIFEVGKFKGADGSNTATVFEKGSGKVVTKCTYDGTSKVEKCSDGTRVKVPGVGDVSYRATYTKQSKFDVSGKGVKASRTVIRQLETQDGNNQLAEAEMEVQVVISGDSCELKKFKGVSEYRVAKKLGTTKWSGVKLKELRELSGKATCKIISR